MPNEIPVVFHNGLNYDYHFIIKELANEFEGQFKCLGENSEKNKHFPFLTGNDTRKADKDENEIITTISYKITISYEIKFIDSAIFMASSVSNFVRNLAEGIHKIKCYDCS